MLVSLHSCEVFGLVFGVICFNPEKVCGAPAKCNRMILSVAEKCQSSVQDPGLSDWE